jgi:hypothetical protein
MKFTPVCRDPLGTLSTRPVLLLPDEQDGSPFRWLAGGPLYQECEATGIVYTVRFGPMLQRILDQLHGEEPAGFCGRLSDEALSRLKSVFEGLFMPLCPAGDGQPAFEGWVPVVLQPCAVPAYNYLGALAGRGAILVYTHQRGGRPALNATHGPTQPVE